MRRTETFVPEIGEVGRIYSFIERSLTELARDVAININKLSLSIDEIFSNTVNHGFLSGLIEVHVGVEDGYVEILARFRSVAVRD